MPAKKANTPDKEIAALEKAVREKPEAGEKQYELANAYDAAGRGDEAALAVRRAAIAGAEDPDWLSRCASAALRLDRMQLALLLARQAVLMGRTPDRLSTFAQILFAAGNRKKAREIAERSLAMDPENLRTQAILGTIRRNQGTLATAEDGDDGGRSWTVHLEGQDA